MRLVKRQSKHALKFFECRLAPRGESVKQHLRIARAAKHAAFCLQIGSQCAEVINLTVEDQAVARGWMKHRLMAGRGGILNGKAAKAKSGHRPAAVILQRQLLIAQVVGAAMHHRVHHGTNRLPYKARTLPDDSAYATHVNAPFSEPNLS